jgi:hypothetical protein
MPRPLTPVQVLSVLISRMEERADCFERVRLDGYNLTILELRRFAKMIRNARDYLQQGPEQSQPKK